MRVLLISEFYLDDTNANGHCARMLVQGLRNDQVNVDVICVRKHENELTPSDRTDASLYVIDDVDTTVKAKAGTIANFYRQIKRARLIFRWPLERPKTAARVIKRAEELIDKNKYDGVIAVHKSYLSVYCALTLKKRNSNLKTVLYLLDPIANQIDRYLGIRRHFFQIVKMRERRAYQKTDYVISMRCNADDPIDQEFKSKISIVDFPLVTTSEREKRNQTNTKKPSNDLRLIYFGTLNSSYRSPEYLLDLLIKASEKVNIDVYFYCQGDCVDEMIGRVIDHKDKFHINGYISQDELMKEIGRSDMAINIGNAVSNMVPSKIFDLLLYGKPILSISKQTTDKSDAYLDKYGASLIIKEDENLNASLERMLEFIEKYKKGEVCPTCDLERTFEESTPAYSAAVLKALLENGHAMAHWSD